MKRIYHLAILAACIVAIFICTTDVQAQVSRTISYQGLLTEPDGRPIPDGDYQMLLRLYDAPVGGSLLWEETQSTPVEKGLFSLYLGDVQPLIGISLSRQLFLETAIVGRAPFPRTHMAMVPYAMNSIRVDSADALTSNASGVVTSVNGADGALQISGRSGILVVQEGDVSYIQLAAPATGIQTITTGESTLRIVNPSGPTVSMDVRDGAISTVKLAEGAVGTSKIADGAVTNGKIGNAAITNGKLADGSVTFSKIAAGVIPSSFPASGPAGGDLTGAYPNPAIANAAVTNGKLAYIVTGKQIGRASCRERV